MPVGTRSLRFKASRGRQKVVPPDCYNPSNDYAKNLGHGASVGHNDVRKISSMLEFGILTSLAQRLQYCLLEGRVSQNIELGQG